MTARLRLAIRRLLVRQPASELWHILCPVARPACPCMQGWDGR